MFLISSAITKAFHGDRGTYARYLRLGERAEPSDMIVHLNPEEQRTIIQALAEQRERQEQAMSQTEQLLRRMTGSITAYMDEVGRYPLHISDYDKTVLAIRDGEFDAFKNLYPRVSGQTDDLLIEVAGRPGTVGGNMTLMLLAAVEGFSPKAYLTACKRAVETGDSWRVQTLVKESEGRLSEPLPSLHGEVILYAYTNNCRNIAKDLIAQCTPEQIASVPPKLLRWVAEKLDFQTAVDLVDKGVRPGDEVAGILRTLTGQHQEWMAERAAQGLSINQSTNMLNIWTKPGQITDIPASTEAIQMDDHLVENASFLRLKNVTVQYELPKSILKHSGVIERFNIFFTGRNLWTLTNFTGYDPEPDINLIKFGYPNTRQFVFGVELTF